MFGFRHHLQNAGGGGGEAEARPGVSPSLNPQEPVQPLESLGAGFKDLGSSVIPTQFGYLLKAVSEVPTLPPSDLQHVPNESAIRPRCRDPGGHISGGSRPRGAYPSPPCGVSPAPPSAGVPRTQHRSGPGAPRTSLVFFLAGPLPQRFPTRRTAGDALPLLQLKFVATCRLPGFCRAEASTVSADWPGRLVLCSPPTSGCDVF